MRKPLLATLAAIIVAAGVLVLDPIGWWSFQFDDADMRGAVEGNWSLTVTAGGKTSSWKLAIKQGNDASAQRSDRGWIKSASACGNRSFVRNASACVDLSTMPLDIAVLDQPGRATGTLEVSGMSFETGFLHIAVGEGAARVAVHATISSDGNVLESDDDTQTVKLVRTSALATRAASQ